MPKSLNLSLPVMLLTSKSIAISFCNFIKESKLLTPMISSMKVYSVCNVGPGFYITKKEIHGG